MRCTFTYWGQGKSTPITKLRDCLPLHDMFADFRRASEGQLADIRVVRQTLANQST